MGLRLVLVVGVVLVLVAALLLVVTSMAPGILK